jgi:hypothetical protein
MREQSDSIPACQTQNDSDDQAQRQAQGQEPSSLWKASQENDEHADRENESRGAFDRNLMHGDSGMMLCGMALHDSDSTLIIYPTYAIIYAMKLR